MRQATGMGGGPCVESEEEAGSGRLGALSPPSPFPPPSLARLRVPPPSSPARKVASCCSPPRASRCGRRDKK